MSEARKAVELECYFSVNSIMLRSERARELVKSLPRGRLLTETDGPFTDETPKPIGPASVAPARGELAGLFGLEPDEMSDVISDNLRQLVG